jgi:two-component system, LytTR family, response regulator
MNCIIIEDEPLAREGMQMHILNYPKLDLLGSFSNTFDATDILKTNKVDIIFLDINMPEMNGLDFVKSLTRSPMIVFATAYPQYATDSYELDAIDYLLKPIRFERFVKAVNKAQDYFHLLHSKNLNENKIESLNDDFIYIKADRKYFKIFFNDILYIEGLKDYVIIHTNYNKIVTAMNLKTIFDKLSKTNFARISKSNIVNIKNVASFDVYYVYMKNNSELPLGNTFKDDFFRDFVDGKVLKK